MYRNAAEAPRSRCGLRTLCAALGLLAGVLAAAPATAETASASGLGLELNATTRQSLLRLEDGWTQWSGALYKDDPAALTAIEDRLLGTARELGMSRLPDLAAGALLAAEEAGRKKDGDRAERALAAAERLDPGRPEVAFAAARVNRLLGRWYRVPFDEARGFTRLPALGLEWQVARSNLWLYLLAVTALAAALFLALQMLTKGPELLADLMMLATQATKRPVGGALGFAVLLLFLLWPLALPAGLLWLLGYWSVLLWGFGSPSERWVTIALWLVLGAAPLGVQPMRQAVGVDLSPPIRAARDFTLGRLHGGIFADLGALAGLLPEHPAVNQFLADVHRKIGQWDHANRRYREIVTAEPGNIGALIDLGAYAYQREDFGAAQDLFQRAIAANPKAAVAHFDLGKALQGALHYDEGGAAIQSAQALDAMAVNEWTSSGQGVIQVDGGLARLPEIRHALGPEGNGTDESSPGLLWFRRYLSVLVSLGAMLLAVGFDLARRRFRPYQRPTSADALPRRRPDRWRGLVPGLESTVAGQGLRSFVALFVPVALVLLPAMEHFGFRIPWYVAPPGLLSWLIAALGLAGLAWYHAAATYGDR